MKTYSLALRKNNVWYTNWHQYMSPDDINWQQVDQFVKENNYTAYGYVYGHNSRNITAPANRRILWDCG